MLTRYIRYSALLSWAGSVNSVISTNSMLSSIVSVPSYSSVLVTNYIGKDIIGQLGGLLFAWKANKKADSFPIPHIMKNVALQHMAFFIENFSISVENANFILPILGSSSLLKNISFIGIGSVSANNIQKISKNKDIGTLYAKIASINTLASTCGMLSGIFFIHMIPSYTIRTVVILPFLTGVSLFAAKRMTEIAQENKVNLPQI